jgi:2-polyprenyl-3-methyl-5-hydroxy-6-metoxy-1,4-benzoquinol methylase
LPEQIKSLWRKSWLKASIGLWMSNENHRRLCPVCALESAGRLWKKGSLLIVRCRGCSMAYVEQVPEEFASGSFYERRLFYLSPEKLESDYAAVRFERELRIFRKWRRTGAVLDVGCSTGAFLHQLRTRYRGDYEVLGTDVTSAALDCAESRGVPVSRQPFLESDFGGTRFDAVTFWAVLEHVLDPKMFLDKAAQILNPGGNCFILVPNLQSLAVRLLGLNYRYITPEHINYFTSSTLRTLALRQGSFDLIDSGSTHFNPVVIWHDFSSRQQEVRDDLRARLLKRTTAWKQNPLLKPAKIVYSGLERTLGRAKLADNIFLVLRRKK